MSQSLCRSIEVRDLRPGQCLGQDIYDNRGLLLLRAGHPVTDVMLRLLAQRGITTVEARGEVDDADESASGNPEASAASPTLTDPRAAAYEPGSVRWPDESERRSERLELGALRDAVLAGEQTRDQMADAYQRLGPAVSSGASADARPVVRHLHQLLHGTMQDASFGPLVLRLQDDPCEYLFDHGVNTAVLTIAVCHYLGFRPDDVVAAGVGALFHDVGMLRVPEEIRCAPRELSTHELALIHAHPTHSANSLARMEGVAMLSQIVSYQMQERADGRGYPRQRSNMFVHPMAKVAAVCDAFVAMTSWRPHRAPIQPHAAALAVIEGVRRGQFDGTVVRAFLDYLSVFPIGSFVMLCDGKCGRVLRGNCGQHTRPVVLPFTAAGEPEDYELDLIERPDLKVVEPIDPASRGLRQAA